jgi:hypothetical protein
VFSKRSVRQLRDATIKLLEVFSMRSVPRCYKQDKSEFSELGESPASKGVNMEAKEVTALEAVTRQRLMKTQQTEKT